MKMPSKRTWLKFLRDGAVALITAAGVFVADNIGILELSPEVSAMAVSVVLLVTRWGRGYLGQEPE